jgi:hypothetical protein
VSARLAPGRRASSGIRSCRKTLSLMPEAVKFHQRRAPAGREEAVSVDSLHQPVGVYSVCAMPDSSLVLPLDVTMVPRRCYENLTRHHTQTHRNLQNNNPN